MDPNEQDRRLKGAELDDWPDWGRICAVCLALGLCSIPLGLAAVLFAWAYSIVWGE